MNAISANDAAMFDKAIEALHREWRQIHAQLSDKENELADDDWEALHVKTWRICDRVMALPSESEADVLAKILMFTCDGAHELPGQVEHPQFWVEVWRLAGVSGSTANS